MITFVKRIFRAIILDAELYEEIPVNHGFLFQSIVIIILSSLSAGIANYPEAGTLGLILVTIISIFCWILWGYITFFITNLLLDTNDQSVDIMEVIRITGFASAPGIIRFLGIIPGLFSIVFLISWIWMVVMMSSTIKHAYDSDMLRAIGPSLIGGVVHALILYLFL